MKKTQTPEVGDLPNRVTSLEQRYWSHHNQLESNYITHYNKMISRVKTIEADFQKLEEEKTQDKTVADKKDLANLTTANQTSQRQMGEAITTLSERIAVLLSYTERHSDVLRNILYFVSDFENAPKSPNQFVQHFHSTFKIWSPDHQSNCF